MDELDNSTIEKSGMLTHLKTVNCLRKNDWSVNISPYYYDNVSDAVKEIDIVAEKQFSSTDIGSPSVQLNVQLFIECKYINQQVFFWFDSVNEEKAVSKLERDSGLSILYGPRTGADILPSEFHYLKSTRIAKLFSTNSGKEDLIYKAISQCLRSQVYYEQFMNSPIVNDFSERLNTKTQIIRFPVVVCDNFKNIKALKVDEEIKNASLDDIHKSFLLETNYIYFNKAKSAALNDYFLIDFIDLNFLSDFLEIMKKEARSIVRSMSMKKEISE